MKMNTKKIGMLTFLAVIIIAVALISGCNKAPEETAPTIPLTIDTRWTINPLYIVVKQDGTVYYQVTPQTLMAYGGSPFGGYTWGKPIMGRFPPFGTTVDLNGVFRGSGGSLVEGNHTFDVEVSDGTHTATATFTARVEEIILVRQPGLLPPVPPPIVVFQQPLMDTVPLVDGKAGKPYAASLFVMGGEPPYSWFFDQNYQSNFALSGLIIDMSGGVVRGTISSAMSGQTISFRVVVRDRTGEIAVGKPIYTINVK